MKRCLGILLVIGMLFCFSAPALAADSDYYQMLINKTYQLNSDYQPSDLVYLNQYMSAGSSVMMTEAAAVALQEMIAAAKKDGVTRIYGSSGYRSYSLQTTLYQNKTNYYKNQGYGEQDARFLAGQVVAPPGASEHQSGMAIDFTTSENGHSMTESFANTEAGRWLAANCWKYGFILRYSEEKSNITGYIYEPWHFRYVGQPHAEYMTKHDMCLEEYIDHLKFAGEISYLTEEGKLYRVIYDSYNNTAVEGYLLSRSFVYAPGQEYLLTVQPPLYDMVGRWSEQEVRTLVEMGIVAGYPDGSFGPTKNINRAELVTLISRMYTLLFPDADAELSSWAQNVGPLFADVRPEHYYYFSVQKVSLGGMLAESMLRQTGTGTYFDAEQKVLRREVALCLAPLFAALPEIPQVDLQLQDMQYADQALRDAVQLLVDYQIVFGDNYGNFNPDQQISREEIAAMLYRMMQYYTEANAENGDDGAADAEDDRDDTDEGRDDDADDEDDGRDED